MLTVFEAWRCKIHFAIPKQFKRNLTLGFNPKISTCHDMSSTHDCPTAKWPERVSVPVDHGDLPRVLVGRGLRAPDDPVHHFARPGAGATAVDVVEHTAAPPLVGKQGAGVDVDGRVGDAT